MTNMIGSTQPSPLAPSRAPLAGFNAVSPEKGDPAPSISAIRAGAPLRFGHRGPSVVTVKKLLNIVIEHHEPKFVRTLELSDHYDARTEYAVRWFQSRFGSLDTHARVDSKTLAAMEGVVLKTGRTDLPTRHLVQDAPKSLLGGSERSAPSLLRDAPSPAVQRAQIANDPNFQLSAPVGHPPKGKNVYRDVVWVQQRLVHHGYLPNPSLTEEVGFRWGAFDEATALAVRAFQSEQTPYNDELVEPGFTTFRRLRSETLYRPRPYLNLQGPVGNLHRQPDHKQAANDIALVQQRLLVHGYLAPEDIETGVLNDATLKGIFHFQLDQLPDVAFADGVVDPAGPTSNLLAGANLPNEKKPYDSYSRDPGVITKLLRRPTSWSTVPGDLGDMEVRRHAFAATRVRKPAYPEEQDASAVGMRMPPWFKVDTFLATTRDARGEPLRETLADGSVRYNALTGVRTPYRNGKPSAGGKLTTGLSTTHFIVHETVGFPNIQRMREIDKRDRRVTMYIGRTDGPTVTRGTHISNDFSVSKPGVKWTSRALSAKLRKYVDFIGVELASPVNVKEDQPYTDGQYRDLAIAYVMASHRAGRFLTVVAHREVDRGIPDGHGDPRKFDWKRLYREISTLTGMPPETTYGYPAVRDTTKWGEKNWRGQANVFPNIYRTTGGVRPPWQSEV